MLVFALVAGNNFFEIRDMKVLVAIKRVVDYNVKVRVKSDGSGVDIANVKMSMNPFDEIAVEQALRLKESGQAQEIIAISIGVQAVQETLRHAFSMGVDRAIHIKTDNSLEPLHVAKILQVIINQEQPQIIILGKQAIDDDCNQTGQMLAALLDYPQGTFVSLMKLNDKQIEVTREVDGGLETLSMRLPVVITTDLRLNEPRYPSLPNIMKAKQKPIETILLDTLNLSLKPHLEVLSVAAPPPRTAGRMIDSIADLMHALKNKEQVLP